MPERKRFKGMENGGFAVPGPLRKTWGAFSVEEVFSFNVLVENAAKVLSARKWLRQCGVSVQEG